MAPRVGLASGRASLSDFQRLFRKVNRRANSRARVESLSVRDSTWWRQHLTSRLRAPPSEAEAALRPTSALSRPLLLRGCSYVLKRGQVMFAPLRKIHRGTAVGLSGMPSVWKRCNWEAHTVSPQGIVWCTEPRSRGRNHTPRIGTFGI